MGPDILEDFGGHGLTSFIDKETSLSVSVDASLMDVLNSTMLESHSESLDSVHGVIGPSTFTRTLLSALGQLVDFNLEETCELILEHMLCTPSPARAALLSSNRSLVRHHVPGRDVDVGRDVE